MAMININNNKRAQKNQQNEEESIPLLVKIPEHLFLEIMSRSGLMGIMSSSQSCKQLQTQLNKQLVRSLCPPNTPYTPSSSAFLIELSYGFEREAKMKRRNTFFVVDEFGMFTKKGIQIREAGVQISKYLRILGTTHGLAWTFPCQKGLWMENLLEVYGHIDIEGDSCGGGIVRSPKVNTFLCNVSVNRCKKLAVKNVVNASITRFGGLFAGAEGDWFTGAEELRGIHFEPLTNALTVVWGNTKVLYVLKGGDKKLKVIKVSEEWLDVRYDLRRRIYKRKPLQSGVYSWGSFFWLMEEELQDAQVSDSFVFYFDVCNEKWGRIEIPHDHVLGEECKWELKGCEGCVVLVSTLRSNASACKRLTWRLSRSGDGHVWDDGVETSVECLYSAHCAVNYKGWWLLGNGDMHDCKNGAHIKYLLKMSDGRGQLRYSLETDEMLSQLERDLPDSDRITSVGVVGVWPFEINNLSWPMT